MLSSSENEAQEVAYHESGHYVISYRFFGDNRVRDIVSIQKRDNSLGRVLEEDILDNANEKIIKNEIIIYLAGYESEIHFNPKLIESAKLGANSDFEQAYKLALQITKNEKESDHLIQLMHIKTKKYVKQNWQAIVDLSKDLLEYGELDPDEAALVIAKSDGDTEAGMSLQNYRGLKLS